jgi:hypothetical protein
MNKLLIYIGEGKKFDVNATINAIKSMEGVSDVRKGNFIGAIFECAYFANDRSTVIRISPEAETITAEGLGDESLEFALQLQKKLTTPLYATDMGYGFNVSLSDVSSVTELRKIISV